MKLKDIVLSATLGLGLFGCSEKDVKLYRNTNIEFSGIIDSIYVDYGTTDYVDSTGKGSYEFMSVQLPDGALLSMSDFDKDGNMDAYNFFVHAGFEQIIIESNKPKLSEKECEKLYKSTRRKIKRSRNLL